MKRDRSRRPKKGRAEGAVKPRRPRPGGGAPAAALLLLVLLVAYLPAIRGGFIWDDPRYVTENETLRSAAGLGRIWLDPGATIQYYPLVFTTFWAEYHVWGANPLGYHLVNVMLHGAGAVLLGLLLRRLSLPGAWFVAALFALHPVQVESVAWITERKNVLSGLLYMAAALSYVAYARPEEREVKGPRRLYALALLLFVLALLAKTVTASLPVAILLLLWWKRGRVTGRDVAPLVPFFVLGAAMGAATSYLEANVVHARGPEWDLSIIERLLIAGRALWFYAGKLLWPARLAFNYPRWAIDLSAWWQYVFPAAAAAAALLARRIGRTAGRGVPAAVFFFGVTLFPALGFVNVYPMRYSFVADHFQYLACIGPAALFVAVLHRIFGGGGPIRTAARGGGKPPRPARFPFPAVALLVALLFLLAALTWRQAGAYDNLETLWRHTLARNPSSFLAHSNLASVLLARGAENEAVEHLREAVRLKPDFYEARCSLGKALLRRGRLDEAKEQLAVAERIRPDKAWAYLFMGDVLLREGREEEAIASCEKAVALEPEEADARINLANALAGAGRPEEAAERYREALRIEPDRLLVHNNLANVLSEMGRYEEAEAEYREALRLEPSYIVARRNLALALSNQGREEEAMAVYEEVIRMAPRDVPSRFNLAELLAKRGRPAEAAEEYRRILAIDPRYGPARKALEALASGREGVEGP